MKADNPLYREAEARIANSDALRPYATWLLPPPEEADEGWCRWILEEHEEDLEYYGETCRLAIEYVLAGG